jgi:hypothetical protein
MTMTMVSNALYCSLCWFMSGHEESDSPVAVSIAGGYALCYDHMDYAPMDDGTFHRLIAESHRKDKEEGRHT